MDSNNGNNIINSPYDDNSNNNIISTPSDDFPALLRILADLDEASVQAAEVNLNNGNLDGNGDELNGQQYKL